MNHHAEFYGIDSKDHGHAVYDPADGYRGDADHCLCDLSSSGVSKEYKNMVPAEGNCGDPVVLWCGTVIRV